MSEALVSTFCFAEISSAWADAEVLDRPRMMQMMCDRNNFI